MIVSFGGDTEYDELIHQLPKLQAAEIIHIDIQPLPEVEIQGIYAEVSMEKQEWKARIKEQVKQILKYKPETVFCRRKSLRGISNRTCTAQKTYPGASAGRKRRTETPYSNPVRFINE